MDSASVMRDHKSGLETRIRDLAPHLIDIDGNICHHFDNIFKKFTGPFNNYIENMFRQIYSVFKASANSMEMLKDISYHLGLTFWKPVTYVVVHFIYILIVLIYGIRLCVILPGSFIQNNQGWNENGLRI